MIDVVIYHNPARGTSRNALGLIRNAGIEPHIIEYLRVPPTRAMLKSLLARMGISELGEFRKEDGHLVVDPGAEAVA
jgi:arsenate reductase